MAMLESARYYVAMLLVISLPGVILYWFSVHPFIDFWRRLDARLALAINYGLILAVSVALFQVRKPLLSIEYGANPALIAISAVLLAVSAALRRKLSRHLPFKTLTGLPELDPGRYPSRLVTEGPYARVRHPRYVQMMLAVLAYALFANYLAGYLTVLICAVLGYFLVLVEEKELCGRFGTEYEAYANRVPRFFPRRGRRGN